MKKGVFIISLDFELSWGLESKILPPAYEQKILLEARKGIPMLLELFKEYKIHATWAIVGFLFFKNKTELLSAFPDKKPNYSNPEDSSYNKIDNIGENEEEDLLHYAASLIKLISCYPNQKIGTHTFSHYCCLAKGQDKNDFAIDLQCAIITAKKYGIDIKSIVFPHGQINKDYLPICAKEGITSYRGNEASWIYKPQREGREPILYRLLRLIDSYINITGHNTFNLEKPGQYPINISSSRFFRPYSKFLGIFEALKFYRISSAMKHAAKNNLIYHFWWHPYNLGVGDEMTKNIKFLRKVLNRFLELSLKYGMESLSMEELTDKITKIDYYEKSH